MAKINPSLAPLIRSLATVKSDPKNARKHNHRNLQSIADSLAKHGQQKPIAVHDGIIIAGNGTYEAARSLGWTELAMIEYSGRSPRDYALSDNRTAELAEWDYEILADTFKDIVSGGGDLGGMGWEAYEYEPLIQAQWNPPPVRGDAEPAPLADAPSSPPRHSDAAPDPRVAVTRDIVLFGMFTMAEQSWILKALQRVRDDSDTILTGEQAITRVCRAFLGEE